MSKNSTLKFVLSGLRARFANSAGSLRDMFREWDTDKSGDVDSGELTVALHGLGFTAVKHEDAEVLIANIDVGGDGKVQYDDFVRLLCPPKQETRAVTCCEADLARINAAVPPTELNLPGRVFFMGGRAVKRVLGPGEAAALRHSSLGDVGNGVASDALRESVMAGVDAAETAIRRSFYSDMMSSSSSSDVMTAVSEAEEGAAAADAALAHLGSSSNSSGGGSPTRKRTTARREAVVELASLPPAVQVSLLMSKGLLPKFEVDNAGARPRAPWEQEDSGEPGPTMDERIAAAHASNAAGREFAARVKAGLASMEEPEGSGPGHGGPGAVHVNYLATEKEREAEWAPLPTHITLPLSPLALTSRAHARKASGVPCLQLPGTERGALAPSSTVNLAHPLSYLTSLGSTALAPPPALLSTLVSGGAGSAGAASVPPPNSLDRSLHSSARLPPRAEGLHGPFSATGARYSHDTVIPDGGADTVVVGHLQSTAKGCEGITAVGASAIPLASGPFFSSAVQRDLDRRINRLRLSARDVLDLPGAGRPTAPHLTAPHAPVPPFSPLASPAAARGGVGAAGLMRGNFSSPREPAGHEGGGNGGSSSSSSTSTSSGSRMERYEARRREFFAASGEEAPAPRSPSAASTSTLGERLSSSRNARASRMGAILGLVSPLDAMAPGGSGSGSSTGAGVPPLALGALTSISTEHAAGSSKTLASAVRHEGQRTTWLLAPPPSMRVESTPEHPSWHYASSARLAQTGTVIPEVAFGRLAGTDKFDNLRKDRLAREEQERRQHAHDWNFEQSDIASRIARKREERGAYKAAIFARKQAQEVMLCAPFPVGDVQI